MRPRVRTLSAAVLCALTLSALPPTASAAPPVGTGSAAGSDRYLVRYALGTDVAAEARALRAQGRAVGRTFSAAVRALVVSTTADRAEALARSPRVEAVEPDLPVQAYETQQSAPWGLDRADQRDLPLSGTYTAPAGGAGVNAYVVDTGVLSSHADFGGRVAPGWSAVADGNGTEDCDGHSTHVAGSLAGSTYGVAKAATVVPVRVLDCEGGGYTSDVVAGLDWVAAHHTAETPAVANLSLGGGASSTVDAAIQGVVADGVTAVVAAGNEAVDACTASPARAPAALTTAATDRYDHQASFSNTGGCVDLYAPGVGITSAAHSSTTGSTTLSGTSMASPHVAGAAVLVLARNPGYTPAQVASAVTGGATTGVVTGAGAGSPNRLLHVEPGAGTAPVATRPSAATNVRATAGSRSAGVTWTRGGDGGSPLTGQTLHVYRGTSRFLSGALPATSATVTGLTAGYSYSFSVVGTNALGSSPESARSNTVTALR